MRSRPSVGGVHCGKRGFLTAWRGGGGLESHQKHIDLKSLSF